MSIEKNKVAIYCRLSDEDRNKQVETDDSISIQNQKSMLVNYACEHNWDIYKIYSDDDYTGADRNRPEFKKLLEDAENEKFNIVLCKTQSRFTRELELVEKYIHGLFLEWGIRFVSIIDNADTDNKGNKKSRQITGLINEWYLEDMSENVRSVLTTMRKNGYHIGSFALYGYKKDPDKKGHLVIDEEAADVVKEVFTLFSKGHGKTAIARILNDRGIPNPTEYKRLKGLRYKQNKNSTLWKYYSISDMLRNEMYIGNMVQGKYGSVSYKTKKNKPRPKDKWYVVKNTHDPVIDMDLWNRVQNLIQQRAKPFKIGKIGLFARKARCMNCGYTMRSNKNHNHYYLQCCNKYVSDNACIGAFISVKKLEQVVLNELKILAKMYLDKDNIEKKVKLCNSLNDRKKDLELEIFTLQKKADDYDKSKRELYIDKVKGIITESEYIDFSRQFSDENERIKMLISELNKQIDNIELSILKGDSKRQIIEQYINLEKLDRETVEKLIDYILIGKKDKETNEIPVEIHWNF